MKKLLERVQVCWANSGLLKRVILTLRFFVSSSIFLSFNSVLVVYFCFTLYGIEGSPTVFLAVFLSTFSVYGLNKATDGVEDSINKFEGASTKGRYYVAASIACFIVSLGIGLLEGPWVFAILLTPLIIGIIYSVKVCKPVPRLKEVLGVKSILVAFSWAFTGSLLPFFVGTVDYAKVILAFLYVFILLFVNTVLFDFLDVKGDIVSGVRTIPVFLGRRRTMYLLLLVNSILLFWLGYCFLWGFFAGYLSVLLFGILYGYGIIWFFTKKRGTRLNAELIVDGEWLPIILTLKLLA